MNSALKERLNFYFAFKEWYVYISKELGYSSQKDYDARDFLSKILKKKSSDWTLEKTLKSFEKELQSKAGVIIYGCGPSLENSVETILKHNGVRFFEKFNNIAADGASIFLKEKKIHLLSVFTDLDGITKNEFGISYIVVHAHGDNIDLLKLFEVDILKHRNIIGTTQVEPVFNVINPGGFTDGDRILFFIRNLLLPSQKIYFVGMDFTNIVGKFSKPNMRQDEVGSTIKIKKLQIAVKLIEWIASKIKNNMYFVNTKLSSTDLKHISISQFEKISDQN